MQAIRSKAKLVIPIAVVLVVTAASAFCADRPTESPADLVRRTVQREIAPGNGGAKVMFTDRKQSPHGSQTKLIVDTGEGMAGILVGVNDKPLTAEERQAEQARLSGLVSNPEQLKKKQKSEKEDEERMTRIMKALPEAFLYESDGMAAGSQEVGKVGDQLVRLKFRPNPRYSPPSHVEQVLTGMQGYILIDAEQCHIAKIDGTLVKDVGFGWGILGRLDRGGHFLVEQAEVLKGEWEVTHMSLSFNGRELLFKSFNIKSDEVFNDFRPVPSSLSFAQGVEMLKRQEAELAQNWQKP